MMSCSMMLYGILVHSLQIEKMSRPCCNGPSLQLKLLILVHVLSVGVVSALQTPRLKPNNRIAGSWHPTTTTTTTTLCLQTNNQEEKSIKQQAAALSASILKSLRKRSTPGPRTPLLDLETDFYDPSTGLHSEGVWHNAMVGIASLRLVSLGMNEDDYAASRIADSLWEHSWDGVSFRRRAYSGLLWDHSPLGDEAAAAAMEQPNYYRESGEHRCVQHGISLVFWSLLALREDVESSRYQEQHATISMSFVNQYWDEDVGRWHTVSKLQGWGTLLRPSASSGKPAMGVSETEGGKYYYRVVDQAIGILACLGILEVLEKKQQAQEPEWYRIRNIVQQSCRDILSEDGFNYGNEDSARSYLGLGRNRNFWHDGWPLLALICARRYAWTDDPSYGEEKLQILFQQLVDRYGHLGGDHPQTFDGTVWHWTRSIKPDTTSGNVRYCGDNALMYAIARNLNWAPAPGVDACESAFHEFISELRSRDEDGLASVADVYRQVRLHPNAELAAFALW